MVEMETRTTVWLLLLTTLPTGSQIWNQDHLQTSQPTYQPKPPSQKRNRQTCVFQPRTRTTGHQSKPH